MNVCCPLVDATYILKLIMFNMAVYQSFYFQYITNTTQFLLKRKILIYYNNFIMEMYETVLLSKKRTIFYNKFTAKSFSVH